MSLKEFIQTALTKVRFLVMEEFNQLPIGLLDMHKSRFQTFDLENGEIEFDLYLPIPVDNFDELMRFTVKKYVAKLKNMADKYFPRGDFCLWDLYYSLPHMKWSVRKDWIPPYDGRISKQLSDVQSLKQTCQVSSIMQETLPLKIFSLIY